MSFHETRLPARLGFGTTGRVERRTEIVTLALGFERRSTPWAHGRPRYLIGAGIRSLDDAAALLAFFEARRGRLHGFRFKDFSDFKSCAPSRTAKNVVGALAMGMVGGFLSHLLAPRQQVEPRIPELQMRSTAEGGPLPAVLGKARVAGRERQ